MKSDLYTRKWGIFIKRVKLFRFVPFVEFVLAAGSLATGKLHEGSDFDVLVGVRQGRIFIARFFAVIIFRLAGYGRRAVDHSVGASDKICLNHFVTKNAYKLKPPYDGTWEELYRSLVPIMGNEEKIKYFFESNDWLHPPVIYKRDERYLGLGTSGFKRFCEFLMGGILGDWLEKLRWLQIKKIEWGLRAALQPGGRIVYTEDELEFHPDRGKFIS